MIWEYLKRFESGLSQGLALYPEYIVLITGAYFSIFSTTFYQYFFPISEIKSDYLQIFIIILGFGLLLISAISLWLSYRNKKTMAQYETENEKLRIQIEELTDEDEFHQDVVLETVRFINQYIGDCVLEFEAQKYKTDRISLYVYDSDGFFPIARYSANPTYNRIRRVKYPLNQGAIRHAYDNGSHFKKYPDPDLEPDEYYRILEEEDHIPRIEAEKFSMKPRLIFGFRIGNSQNPRAVFIVESTKNTGRFTKTGLETDFQSPTVKMCMDIILKLELPNPNIGDEWEETDTNCEVNYE